MVSAPAARRVLRRSDVAHDDARFWRVVSSVVLPEAVQYELSVIVPTRNEASSIGPLLEALRPALAGIAAEVIFVDDSTDDTPLVIENAALDSPLPIRLRHRSPSERMGGLGGAVRVGFEAAKGQLVAVMDADLQHPPAVLREMVAAADEQNVDLVVGSRFVGAGSVGEFGVVRKAISRGSSMLAKFLFPKRLRGVSDPMSGLFLVRRLRLAPEKLQPHGFKILLEVLVRSAPLRVAEVPYTFGERVAGESKASLREAFRYLRHLLRLRLAVSNFRLIKFGLVGISGLVVNMALLALLTSGVGLFYLASAFVATEVSIGWNFALSERFVFDGGSAGSRFGRFVAFAAVNNIAFAASGPLLWLLVTRIGLHYLIANLLSITALMIVRFVVCDRLIWGRRRSARSRVGRSAREVLAFAGAGTARSSG